MKVRSKEQMSKEVEHLLVEFRELMIIRRSLPPSPSRKKVKEQLREINAKLVDEYWDELPHSIIKRMNLKPRKLPTPPLEETKKKINYLIG